MSGNVETSRVRLPVVSYWWSQISKNWPIHGGWLLCCKPFFSGIRFRSIMQPSFLKQYLVALQWQIFRSRCAMLTQKSRSSFAGARIPDLQSRGRVRAGHFLLVLGRNCFGFYSSGTLRSWTQRRSLTWIFSAAEPKIILRRQCKASRNP